MWLELCYVNALIARGIPVTYGGIIHVLGKAWWGLSLFLNKKYKGFSKNLKGKKSDSLLNLYILK
jgi:hypothetical protein